MFLSDDFGEVFGTVLSVERSVHFIKFSWFLLRFCVQFVKVLF